MSDAQLAAPEVQAPVAAPVKEAPAAAPAKSEPGKKVSVRESIMSALGEVERRHSTKEPDKGASAAAKSAELPTEKEGADGKDTTAGVARDASGKFVKSGDKADPQGDVVADAAKAAAEARPAEADAAKAAKEELRQPKGKPPIPAPPGWRGDGKTKWASLPYDVKQEISADYQRMASYEAKFAPLEAIIAPARNALIGEYGSEANAIKQLIALRDLAVTQPLRFIQGFAAQRGINLQQLVQASQPPGQQSEVVAQQPSADDVILQHPVVKQMMNELNGLKQQWTQFGSAQEQALQAQVTSKLQTMATDHEKYPYFTDVRVDMGKLMLAGLAGNEEDAYDMAVNARKDIRERIRQQADASRAAEQSRQSAEQVAKAKAAAVSITGAPGGTVPTVAAKPLRKETVGETIRRLYPGGANGVARI